MFFVIKFMIVLLFNSVVKSKAFEDSTLQVATEYFQILNANNIVFGDCSTERNHDTVNFFMKQGFQTAVLATEFSGFLKQLSSVNIVGVLLNTDCPETTEILRFASYNKWFNLRRPWFLVYNEHINRSVLEESFFHSAPPFFNVTEYFLIDWDGVVFKNRMETINGELNEKIMKEIEEEMPGIKDRQRQQDETKINTKLKPLTEIEASVDSMVTIAIPSLEGTMIYQVHRKTNHSALELEFFGIKENDPLLWNDLSTPATVRRKNYNRTVMRAGCALFYYNYFNRSEELTMEHYEVWAQMTFEHTKLHEEVLNFRMLVKCFDDYGWPTNGQWNGLVGYLQRTRGEMAATGLIHRTDRQVALEYLDATFQFELGLLFRQPNLASVTNIFILPFSKTVWLSLLALLFITGAILWWQLRVGQWLHHDALKVETADIFSFLTGVMCQQGHSLGIETLAVRISVISILICSLFLFTSYSATIVALLQSPAYLINSLEDVAKSSLGMAIEDLPYARKMIEEDDHEIVRTIYHTKIQPFGEDAFLNTSEGIRKVRTGMFAFQCELTNGYKLIKDTYTESDKCGLKKIDLFPNRLLGPAAPKRSPYKETFRVRMRWLREVGITNRIVNRWYHRKPSCESSHREFISVTIHDVLPLIFTFAYGLAIAVILALLELIVHEFKLLKKVKEPEKVFKKVDFHWQFTH